MVSGCRLIAFIGLSFFYGCASVPLSEWISPDETPLEGQAVLRIEGGGEDVTFYIRGESASTWRDLTSHKQSAQAHAYQTAEMIQQKWKAAGLDIARKMNLQWDYPRWSWACKQGVLRSNFKEEHWSADKKTYLMELALKPEHNIRAMLEGPDGDLPLKIEQEAWKNWSTLFYQLILSEAY